MKFEPVPGKAPATPAPSAPADALQEEIKDRSAAAAAELAAVKLQLQRAREILKDIIQAGVLTDGFMTVAVGASLLQQAEAAKKFFADFPE